MRFGHFDDARREYVIETPCTPLPWINYLGSEDFFALVSNTAGGYAFYRDARLRRLTRYRYNNCPLDSDGFHVYVKDGDTVWNPGWQPTQTELDEYECRHGLGYTILRGVKNDVAVRQEMLVPKGDNCLLIRLTVTNGSDAPRTVSLFPYVEFCLWDAMDDSSNFQRNFSIGEVELEPNAIYHKTEYRERRDHYAVLWADRPYEGFDTSRDAFMGVYGAPSMPQAVKNGACTGSVAHGWAPTGAMQFTLPLAPGASRSLLLGLGYIENPEDAKWSAPGVINKEKAHAMMERYSSGAAFDRALSALWDHWSRLLDGYQVFSGDEKLNRMVNIWNQYQCMVTFNMSRSASYFESGMGRGMGFRDSCQDLLGFVHMIPRRARERILDIAATQFPDGSAYHQYQPLTKKGNLAVGSGFNDDPLWLIAGTDAYLRETGDWTILDEPVPFDTQPGTEQPLLEHLRRSFRYTVDHLGPHGLPLIGRADWNDCLNLNCFSAHPGESFQTTGPSEGPVAESVFIAGMFVKYGRAWADICRHLGLDAEAGDAESAIAAMEQTVLDAGWDGEWFRRAYDAFGAPVGSRVCEEGRIFIEPQGMCVMAGIGAATGQAAQALASVQRYLDTQYGIVLLHPAYIWSWARSPAIPPATRRTPASSATTTRGSPAPRQCWGMAHEPSRSTARPARPISRTSARSTAPSRMCTARWWPARTRPPSARARTAGSPAQRPGRSSASRRPFSAYSPRWTASPSIPVSPQNGQASLWIAATAAQSTASPWRTLTMWKRASLPSPRMASPSLGTCFPRPHPAQRCRSAWSWAERNNNTSPAQIYCAGDVLLF